MELIFQTPRLHLMLVRLQTGIRQLLLLLLHVLLPLLSDAVVAKLPSKPRGSFYAHLSVFQIFVHRRQIYLPRYHIVRHLAAEEVNLILQSEGGCRNESPALYEHTGTYIIPETEFIVVSRYHSRHIASLKTGRNPCYANSTEPRQNFSYYPYQFVTTNSLPLPSTSCAILCMSFNTALKWLLLPTLGNIDCISALVMVSQQQFMGAELNIEFLLTNSRSVCFWSWVIVCGWASLQLERQLLAEMTIGVWHAQNSYVAFN